MFETDIAMQSHSAVLAQLRAGHGITLHANSDSMVPSIRPGDAVEIIPAGIADLKPGDIVLADLGAEWLVHRLVALRTVDGNTWALTRGDNNTRLDSPLPVADVRGRVSAIRAEPAGVPPLNRSPYRTGEEPVLLASFPGSRVAPEIIARPDAIDIAQRESLAPLVYYHNRAVAGIGGSRLRKAHMANLARNTVFLDQLSQMTRTLNGIDFIVLKGAWLASRIYPSPGLRPFSDIDILISPGDLATVAESLARTGYTAPPATPRRAGGTSLNSAVFRRTDGTGAALHVHWHLANSIMPKYMTAAIDMRKIRDSARPAGDGWRELCPEHAVIHLAEHAMRHSFDRLILVRDIAELALRFGQTIDWDLLVRDSKAFNLARHVYYSLLFTAAHCGIPAPPDMLESLKPRRRGFCERIFFKLIAGGVRSPELCNLVYLDNTPTFGGKIEFMRRSLLPDRAVMAAAYGVAPEDIGPATYARRIMRGMRHLAVAAKARSSTRQ